MLFKKALILTILVLFVALSIVGCGGEQSSSDVDPIRVGAPIPKSGWAAADGMVMEKGIMMAVEDINKNGGVLGRPLELVIFDTEDLTPEKLVAAADKLVMEDQVDVIVTGYATPGASMAAFGRYNVPFLHFEGSELDVEMVRDNNYYHIFMLGDIEDTYGRMTFDNILNLPYEFPNNKIAVMAADFEWDLKIIEAVKNRAIELGWEVVVDEVFDYGNREWGTQLAKIRAEDPAIIFISVMDAADAKTFIDQFIINPTNSILDLSYVVAIPEFANIVGANGEGVLGISTNSILPNEVGQEFTERYRERFNEEPGLSILGTVYDGLMLWAAAVEQIGVVSDYEAVSQAIADNIYNGVNGTYLFDVDQKAPAGDDGLPMHHFQVQSGELVRLFLGTQQQADFIMPPWINQ